MTIMMEHNCIVAQLRKFDRSGPPLFYLNCAKCKYDFIGSKKQTRCASCRAKKRE
jgi:hypothetical protein